MPAICGLVGPLAELSELIEVSSWRIRFMERNGEIKSHMRKGNEVPIIQSGAATSVACRSHGTVLLLPSTLVEYKYYGRHRLECRTCPAKQDRFQRLGCQFRGVIRGKEANRRGKEQPVVVHRRLRRKTLSNWAVNSREDRIR